MATMRALSEGVALLANYSHSTDTCLRAERNILRVGPRADAVSNADAEQLEALGWTVDEQHNQWSLYT